MSELTAVEKMFRDAVNACPDCGKLVMCGPHSRCSEELEGVRKRDRELAEAIKHLRWAQTMIPYLHIRTGDCLHCGKTKNDESHVVECSWAALCDFLDSHPQPGQQEQKP